MRFSKEDKRIIKFIIIVFLLWRAGLFLTALLGAKMVPLRQGFLGESIWANFDGVHYLLIAQRGYGLFQQAFFPFYPYLIRVLAVFIKDYLLSGLLISHLSFIVSLFLFYKLVRLDFAEVMAKRSVFSLILFPTSFYFVSVYTESLFLALILGAFYAARKKQWWLAGVLGGFASATRIVGIFLLPALLVEWWQEKKKKSCWPLILIASGLLSYMWYLQRTTGDPFNFIHVLPKFGPDRTSGKIILLYQVFWRYLKMLVTVDKMTTTYFVVALEALTGIGFLGLLILAYRLKIRLNYLVFAGLAYLTPTLTGTFTSLPRYVLVCFPCFIVLALVKNKIFRYILFGLNFLLLTLCVVLFTRGYWIA